MNIPKQRLAVVTGGSAGIGEAICHQLLDAGWAVVSMARRPPPFTHEHLHSVEVDLSDRAATAAAAEDVAHRFAPDTIIHNAGVILPALLPDVRLQDLDKLVDIHLSTAILLAQACLPAMKAAGFGRIVLLSSRGALGLATRTAYAATKAGMLGMARTWALELAPHGIRVASVAPGVIQTPILENIAAEARERLRAGIPVGRFGDPGEVWLALRFVLECGFFTGRVLEVDGGAQM
jgi:3-oxoacyl-[acyl-carrier protein] reductase